LRSWGLVIAAAGFGLVSAGVAPAQQPPEVEFTELGSGSLLVRVMNADGSQIGANMVVFRAPNGTVLVDTDFPNPQLARFIRQSVEGRVGALSAVVVTHWHPDHSGGIGAYADLPVYAHPGTIRRLSEETIGIDLGRLGGRFTSPPRPVDERPDHPADEGDRLAGGDLRLHHSPAAHTDGDLYVAWPDGNVVAMGDLLWPGRFPSVDVHNGGSAEGVRDAIRAALQLGDEHTIFVPGHGDPASRHEVEAFASMLDETIEIVRREEARGATLPAIQAANPLARWADWAHALVPADQWIKLIHSGFSN
jgi:glyoxylase-like metal-dependent hydrolase (beta-lactamase superfamily II)